MTSNPIHRRRASGTGRTGRAEAAPRRAMTLAELLIVIGIMLTLFSMALPTALSLMSSGRIREAARIVQAQLAGARERALLAADLRGIRLIPEQTLTGEWTCRTIYPVRTASQGSTTIVMEPGARPIRLPEQTRIVLSATRSANLPGVSSPGTSHLEILFNARGVVGGPGAANGLIYLWLESTEDRVQRILIVVYARTGMVELYDVADPATASTANPLVRELIPTGL